MDRVKAEKGASLLELLVAISLLVIVVLSAANILTGFGSFSSNLVKSETSLMGTAFGAFERIVNLLTAANEVTIPASYGGAPAASIDIRVDDNAVPRTPSNYGDDNYYTFTLFNGQLYQNQRVGVAPNNRGNAFAKDIFSLSFTRDATDRNRIKIILEARASVGTSAGTVKERLETTIVMRSRRAAS